MHYVTEKMQTSNMGVQERGSNWGVGSLLIIFSIYQLIVWLVKLVKLKIQYFPLKCSGLKVEYGIRLKYSKYKYLKFILLYSP